MTRVLRLELKGFKSFAERTTIPFGEDFNCILGPNGSGKSNILDSICFVLGRMSAKSMRAEKTANLIYNGGKNGKPAKQGEVHIYFDNSGGVFNTGGDELKVSRIVKKSGSSTYRMNGEDTTRSHILETLRKAQITPDGYNIILQGDVTRLVEMSDNERREIIEEIAGIHVYEEKREKALRELDRVEDKLEEATLILRERETRLDELRDDKEKAQEFQDLKNKLRRNKATLLQDKLAGLEEKVEAADKKIETHKQNLEEKQGLIDDLRQEITERKEKIEAINDEVEEKGEDEQVEIHKEIEGLKVEIAKKKQRVDDLEEEKETIKHELEEFEEERSNFDSKTNTLLEKKRSLQSKKENVEDDLEEVKAELERFKEEHRVGNAAEIDEEIEDVDQEIEEQQQRVDELREKQQTLLREKDKKETLLETVEERIRKIQEAKEENQKDLNKLQQYKKEYKQTSVDLSKALAEDSDLSSQQSNVRKKLHSTKEKHAKLQAKTARIRERLGGSRAIQGILDKGYTGVHGILSELGSVDKKYAKALQVAAGSRAKSIVTESADVASKCIQYLKKNKLGYANFIPLDKIKASTIKPSLRNMSMRGVIGLAIDLVDYDPKYDKAFRYALGNTLVVENIRVAKKVGIGKVRMITVDGDKVDRSGAMQGGHRRSKKALGFTQRENAQKLEALKNKIKDLKTTEQQLDQRRTDLEEKIQRLRTHKSELEGEVIKLEKSLRIDAEDADESFDKKDELEEQIAEQEDKVFTVQNQIKQENKELAKLKQKKQRLRDQLSQMRSSEINAELSSYQSQIEEYKEQLQLVKNDLHRVKVEEENVLGPKLKEMDSKIAEKKERLEAIRDRKQGLEEDIEEMQDQLETREEKQEAFYEEFKELFSKRKRLSKEVSDRESRIVNLNSEIKQEEQKQSAQKMNRAKYMAKLQSVEDEYEDYEGVPVFREKDLKVVKEEIDSAEEMMDDLGAVNMKALEIYDAVKERYESLKDKQKRLQEERESVLVMINEVDTKKTDLFLNTFKVVNHNFQQIFKTLSSKGEATLELEDEDDPLSGGMTMKVRLSGNKYMDIRSLSGGEKTMTALAFIFAVQEHEPHAFYVLDEVDAALDQKNSDRLADLVKQYTDRSQYIMISHNDGVIQEADNLYGISMNDEGVSKVTTLEM